MLKNNEKGLTLTQQKAVTLLVSKDINGMTIGDIADELGISRQAIYKWKYTDTVFIEELNKEAEKVMDVFVVECYDVLQEIIRNDKETTNNRLQAIDKVMKLKGKYVDKQSIEVSQKQSQGEVEVKRQEVIEMEKKLLESGKVTQEEIDKISKDWDGNVENIKLSLETIEMEKELMD